MFQVYIKFLEKINDNDFFMWQFEPYYYLKIRETLEDYIFHVSETSLKENIKRHGLIAQRNKKGILLNSYNEFEKGNLLDSFKL